MTTGALIAIIAAIGGTVNILFMGLNLWMMTNIKLAVQEIRTEIADNRRNDNEKMRAWVEERLQSHCLQCASYSGRRHDFGAAAAGA